MIPRFETQFRDLGPEFSADSTPTPLHDPALITWNIPLAEELGLEAMSDAEKLALCSGAADSQGTRPIATVYAGHQFGQFVPVLGDGRAHLLGERPNSSGQVFDVQLKGSGQTPFSRRGDGRAWLGPVLREYIVSEAMHALGIPTTRALGACVSTTQTIQRERTYPAAVITRVATAHLRVGSFQYFAARGDKDALGTLLRFACERLGYGSDDPEAFLRTVMQRQIALICEWMRVGFVHGVMNTDNTAISGETIDFGPCAFLEEYAPLKTFSSIDQWGRYAFMRQKDIIFWNLSQLASALIPLMSDEQKAIERFTQMLETGLADMERQQLAMWAGKLQFSYKGTAQEDELITGLLRLFEQTQCDFTNGFVSLEEGHSPLSVLSEHPDFGQLYKTLQHLRETSGRMASRNPRRLARNHVIEQVIRDALDGDFSLFHRVAQALQTPYDADEDHLLPPAAEHERVARTFCGT